MFLRNHNCKFVLKQDGAGEACWAHNPEVGRSKLSPAQFFLRKFIEFFLDAYMYCS